MGCDVLTCEGTYIRTVHTLMRKQLEMFARNGMRSDRRVSLVFFFRNCSIFKKLSANQDISTTDIQPGMYNLFVYCTTVHLYMYIKRSWVQPLSRFFSAAGLPPNLPSTATPWCRLHNKFFAL